MPFIAKKDKKVDKKINMGFDRMNPHIFVADKEKATSLKSINRVDAEGRIYCMDCNYDYTDLSLRKTLGILKVLNYGRNPVSTGQDEKTTVIVKCAHEGKYKSTASSEMTLLNTRGTKFDHGSLDDGKTDISLALLLPWLCLEGTNEKGLSVSVLNDVDNEEEIASSQSVSAKPKIAVTEMVRHMLDDCSDVVEAITLAKKFNLTSTFFKDNLLAVKDKMGRSVILEWKNDLLNSYSQTAKVKNGK